MALAGPWKASNCLHHASIMPRPAMALPTSCSGPSKGSALCVLFKLTAHAEYADMYNAVHKNWTNN